MHAVGFRCFCIQTTKHRASKTINSWAPGVKCFCSCSLSCFLRHPKKARSNVEFMWAAFPKYPLEYFGGISKGYGDEILLTLSHPWRMRCFHQEKFSKYRGQSTVFHRWNHVASSIKPINEVIRGNKLRNKNKGTKFLGSPKNGNS